MVSGDQTNFLYLADSLPARFPLFYKELAETLNRNQVKYDLLPSTKDIWAVDYMPVQLEPKKFVRFTYYSTYIREDKYADIISDADLICEQIRIKAIKSEIIIDGGNLTHYKDQVMRNILRLFDMLFIPGYRQNRP